MEAIPQRILPTLDPSAGHTFTEPVKRIHTHEDVPTFLTTKAYTDIMTFLLQLNRSMFPSQQPDGTVQSWPLNSDAIQYSAPVRQLQQLLSSLEMIIQEAPPDTGPRRFGNVSFRKWFQIVESRASGLLEEYLSTPGWSSDSSTSTSAGGGGGGGGYTYTAKQELLAYFLGSWGSAQRLDYGTGHELSFLAFLAGVWKLNGFAKVEPGVEERAIVLGIVQPYLELVRTLIKTYTLEPAGSHGVWGLDDHSFLPYIFGAAQLSPAISQQPTSRIPEEGSDPKAPSPSSVTKPNIVDREKKTNLYFSAIGFIYDVKRGPFWEHSPMLYDISGIRAGWAKINKGMIKMYNAEVLSKFPVVQHFPFGSLFSWERDPLAVLPQTSSVHALSGPTGVAGGGGGGAAAGGTRAPWATAAASPSVLPTVTTRAPWVKSQSSTPTPSSNSDMNVHTKAPWAKP